MLSHCTMRAGDKTDVARTVVGMDSHVRQYPCPCLVLLRLPPPPCLFRAEPFFLPPTSKHSQIPNTCHVIICTQTELLAERLAPGFPDIEAEVVFAARNEFCETAADFLCRRSRLAFLDADAAMCALPRVVDLLAKEHKWDSKRKKAELSGATKAINQFRAASIAAGSS
eukprot:TRINITY_DN2995_c0_g1_i1.p1 TRINITY_DN2995_c0_g1~~TRINITY_DN2995_c0_g1_i1.p1  ORF type:complete len:169 (-),score=3.78 TRINITY_DN2995_c0_g1_i1:149-655(-)